MRYCFSLFALPIAQSLDIKLVDNQICIANAKNFVTLISYSGSLRTKTDGCYPYSTLNTTVGDSSFVVNTLNCYSTSRELFCRFNRYFDLTTLIYSILILIAIALATYILVRLITFLLNCCRDCKLMKATEDVSKAAVVHTKFNYARAKGYKLALSSDGEWSDSDSERGRVGGVYRDGGSGSGDVSTGGISGLTPAPPSSPIVRPFTGSGTSDNKSDRQLWEQDVVSNVEQANRHGRVHAGRGTRKTSKAYTKTGLVLTLLSLLSLADGFCTVTKIKTDVVTDFGQIKATTTERFNQPMVHTGQYVRYDSTVFNYTDMPGEPVLAVLKNGDQIIPDVVLVGNIGIVPTDTFMPSRKKLITVDDVDYNVFGWVMDGFNLIVTHDYPTAGGRNSSSDLIERYTGNDTVYKVNIDQDSYGMYTEVDHPPAGSSVVPQYTPVIMVPVTPTGVLHHLNYMAFIPGAATTRLWHLLPMTLSQFASQFVAGSGVSWGASLFFIAPTVDPNHVLVAVTGDGVPYNAPYVCREYAVYDNYQVGMYVNDPTVATGEVFLFSQYGIGRACDPGTPRQCSKYVRTPYDGVYPIMSSDITNSGYYTVFSHFLDVSDPLVDTFYYHDTNTTAWFLKPIDGITTLTSKNNNQKWDFLVLEYQVGEIDENNQTTVTFKGPVCKVFGYPTNTVHLIGRGMPVQGGVCLDFDPHSVYRPEASITVDHLDVSYGELATYAPGQNLEAYIHTFPQHICDNILQEASHLGFHGDDLVYSLTMSRSLIACALEHGSIKNLRQVDTASVGDPYGLWYISGTFLPDLVPVAKLPPVYPIGNTYLINYTKALGECSAKNKQGCYNHAAPATLQGMGYLYDSSPYSEVPNSTVNFYDSPYGNASFAATHAERGDCEAKFGTIDYYFCVYPAIAWTVAAVIILLFLLFVLLIGLCCRLRCREKKQACRLNARGYQGIAVAYLRGDRAIMRRVRDGEELPELNKEILDDYKPTKKELQKLKKCSAKDKKDPEKKKLLTASYSQCFIVIILPFLTTATALIDMSPYTYWKTTLKQGEYAAQHDIDIKDVPAGFADTMTARSFQLPIGLKAFGGTVSNNVCTNGVCTCDVSASVNNVQLIPGSVTQIKASCGTDTTSAYRIVSVYADYDYEYQYSTATYTWTQQQDYSCAGSCASLDCLPLKPSTNYPSRTGYVFPVAQGTITTCCWGFNEGYLLGVGVLRPNLGEVVHVFRATFTKLHVVYCLQNGASTKCWDTASTNSGPVSFNFGNAALHTGFLVGYYIRENKYVKLATGNFATPGSPSWNIPGDVQFTGFNNLGDIKLPMIASTSGGLEFTGAFSKGCAIPQWSNHDKHGFSLVRTQKPGISLLTQDDHYPPLMNSSIGVRVRNGTLKYSLGIPVLEQENEYINGDLTATAIYTAQHTVPEADLFVGATTVSIAECRFTVGDLLNNKCVLTIVWLRNDLSFSIELTTNQMSAARPTTTLIVEPQTSQYDIRFNVYEDLKKLDLNIIVGGKTVSTVSTEDVVVTGKVSVSQSGEILDTRAPIGGGNTYLDTSNSSQLGLFIALIVVAVVVFLIAVICCCFHRRTVNSTNIALR